MSIVTSTDAFFSIDREISPRYGSLKPDFNNAVMCTRSWYPAELKSIIGCALGFGEMLEDMELLEDAFF